MAISAERLRETFGKAGMEPEQADRLVGLCGELAGRTSRPDMGLVEASLRRLVTEYIVPRQQSALEEASTDVTAQDQADEADRLLDVLVRHYNLLLTNLMACGLYDLAKVATAATKLRLAVGQGEDLETEMASRFDQALMGVPGPLLDRALAEVGTDLAPRIDSVLDDHIAYTTAASLGGVELPEATRVFITSSVLFAWFYDVFPYGPRIIATSTEQNAASVG